MIILKRNLKIHGKIYKENDVLPKDVVPERRVQTFINVGWAAKASEDDLNDCQGCGKQFLKRVHNQKYCTPNCRKKASK